MGNIKSKEITENKSIVEKVNEIAGDLILKQNITELSKLNKKEYCDKLVLITSKVLFNKIGNKDIEILRDRIYGDNIVSEPLNDNFSFILKDSVDNLDVEDAKIKQSVCINIAKFYIKIANLWYAIISTIKPVGTYINDNDEKINIE